jgi:hypothetical protein
VIDAPRFSLNDVERGRARRTAAVDRYARRHAEAFAAGESALLPALYAKPWREAQM